MLVFKPSPKQSGFDIKYAHNCPSMKAFCRKESIIVFCKISLTAFVVTGSVSIIIMSFYMS